jgi:hypothetical protein
MDLKYLLLLLENTKQQTLECFALGTLDERKTYEKNKWNIRQILVHLADAEAIRLERIKRTIAEPNQIVWGFNSDKWCMHLNYETFPKNLACELYKANRESMIYLAQQYYVCYGNQVHIHNQTGKQTLKEEFEQVAEHNLNHLMQIYLALEKKYPLVKQDSL